jgi:uncharacterized membrane protein YphA (DoxX/SURF4 family)
VARALSWVGLAVRLGAAGIWLTAALAKLGSLQQFHAQVQAYKLLPGLLEAPFAYALPFLEVWIGTYLVLGLLVREAASAGCVLMVLFIAAQAQAWARGLSLDCGCFGALSREQVGLGTVLRGVGLGLPGLVLALLPARFLSLDHAWLGRPDPWSAAWRELLRAGSAALGTAGDRDAGLRWDHRTPTDGEAPRT